MPANSATAHHDKLGDFSTNTRLLVLSAMALVVGSMGAGAAFCLLGLIRIITNAVYLGRFTAEPLSFAHAHLAPWTIAIPVAGSLVVGLMARFGSEKIRGHGIPEAIEAILIGESRIGPKVALLKPLSSAISIGTGGPFGAEGPIIMTGGALGSLFAQFFHVSASERKTLLVAGAAAGMSAVFGTPIAAVLLAVELLLFEWKPRSFIPVAIASLVAAAWRPWLIGVPPLFPYMAELTMPFWGLGLCAAMGVVAGLQSALMTLCLYATEDVFARLPIHWMWWPAIGGLVVGIGGLIDPAALGVGYDNIRALLGGGLDMHAAALLIAVKAAIWIVALSSGTSGGVLAPLLIMGGALGALEAQFLPFGDSGYWALIGMAAILGGTMRAPLTSTLFAVELTGNLHMLPALFVASIAAFAVTVLLMRRSILTERIARRGHHITREYAIDPFARMRVCDIMVAPADALLADMTVTDAVALFAGVSHKSYPVVDRDARVLGMVSRSDALHWSRDGWHRNLTLGEACAGRDLVAGYADELAGQLADRMAAADVGRVPILARNSGRLMGLVARKDLLSVRAQTSREEHERKRLLPMREWG